MLSRLILAIMISCTTSCDAVKREPGEKIISFREDVAFDRISVSLNNRDFDLSVFSSVQIDKIRSNSITIYVMPPPSRYKYDDRSGSFGYWHHYVGLSSASSLKLLAGSFDQKGRPFIILALPGTYGTSGDRRLQHELAVVDIVDAAVSRIAKVVGAKEVHLVGQSTTAPIVGGLVFRRSDIGCMAISSGPYDYPDFVRERGWPSMYSGARMPFSALSLARARSPSQNARIFVIADKRDALVPFKYSVEMNQVLLDNGYNSQLISANSSDPLHHSLQYMAVQWVSRCATSAEKGAW